MTIKAKLTWGVLVLLGLSVAVLAIFNSMKHPGHADDSVEAMKTDTDAMAEMNMDKDSMGEMTPGHDGMAGMDEHPSSGSKKVTGYSGITLDTRKQQLIGVKTDTVSKRALKRLIRTYGTVSHDTELYTAQQEYLSAYKYYRSMAGSDDQGMARALLDAARKKLLIQGYSDVQIRQLAARGESDESLIEGGNSARKWIYAQIYQRDLPYVRRGQRVQISSPELQGKMIFGSIESLDTVVERETRSVRARILVVHSDPALMHESYVNVEIEVPMNTVLTIPEEAVINTGGRHIAFVKIGDGYFEPRELVLGRRAEGYYEVLSGVAEGERVVSSANFFIDSESQLKAAAGNMSGGHQHK